MQTKFTQQPSLKENVNRLAQFTQKFATEAGEHITSLEEFSNRANEVLNALISIIGRDSVAVEIEKLRKERKEQQEKQQIESFEFLKSNGVLVPVETVDLETVIVGTDTLQDGSSNRVQFDLENISKEFMPLYISKKVGDVVEGNGAKLTITELYKIDKVKAAEMTSNKPQPPTVDNEHVVPGGEKFTEEVIAANKP
jgi:hypothetical protein